MATGTWGKVLALQPQKGKQGIAEGDVHRSVVDEWLVGTREGDVGAGTLHHQGAIKYNCRDVEQG